MTTIASLRPAATDAPAARSATMAAIALAALIALLYGAGAWSNGFVYDDHEVIENQYPIHSFKDLSQIFREPHYLNFPYYRPITRATFALQKTIWGNNPRAFHLFNANLAGLVMLAAFALLRRPGFGIPPYAALMAATWFAVHPAASECVYPAASGRETLLPALVMLAAMWAFLHRGTGAYVAAALLFAMALFCKEQAAVLPGLFFLADVLRISPANPAQRRPITWWLARYLPMVLILAGYFYVRRLVFGANVLQFSVQDHPLEPLQAMLYGLQTTLVPFMELRYEPAFNVWFIPWMSALAALAAMILLVWVTRSRPAIRAAGAFWLGWFLLLQLPTAHLFKQQEAPFSERYVFLAMLAIPAVAAAVLSQARFAPRTRQAVITAAMLWTGILGYVSFLRGSFYFDDESFATQWLDTNPASVSALNGVALVNQKAHHDQDAIRLYGKALEIDSDNVTAHNNLANLLADHHQYEESARHYKYLLKKDPQNAVTLCGYGQMLIDAAYDRHSEKLFLQAQDLITRAVLIKPSYARAHYLLGLCHAARGNRLAAITELERAIALQPDWTAARQKLAALKAMPATRRN